MSRLLVAEQDVAVRAFVAHLLACAGYVVTAVADGEAALASLMPFPSQFAAAVLDQAMFGLTGSEVVARIRLPHPRFPVLLLSGGMAPPLAPYTRFLAKPFRPERLVREVANVLALTGAAEPEDGRANLGRSCRMCNPS